MRMQFELDPEIIHHIIFSQAGSIGKALIELLMNSVDAHATWVRLTVTKEGFICVDDGKGFSGLRDVKRYFGRFGTPHREGDATFGRFRLGRGQIMAHASTLWKSKRWKMAVDTRTMGYGYDLDPLRKRGDRTPGCEIAGTWYEELTETEMLSTVQEVRDLVRYTPIKVELNGRVITRDPSQEKWDFEDELAYYRAKDDGAVSIYNQGVLVRHDPGHIWGAGGLIVSKRAIALNVSRTEILRKTCPVWKAVAKEFGRLADEVSARLGDHRKTEARREKSARALLSGDPDSVRIYFKEEVITLLPGKRHVTMDDFLRKAYSLHEGRVTVVENGTDVPKGEAIAREGICQVVHPQTMQRFGCYSPEDFAETLEFIVLSVWSAIPAHDWSRRSVRVPELVDFATLREAYVERTRIVLEKNALDKETRRAWVAMRWVVQQFAGVCAGGHAYAHGGRLARGSDSMHILLGESNRAEAWTDGDTYIAINVQVVKQLKTEPVRTAGHILSLVVHEIAHQGDSIECGHDEAFYQRYHDISSRNAGEHQRYMHLWLMKYARSLEDEGRKGSGRAWFEQRLIERVGSGRQKRGLPVLNDDMANDPSISTPAVPENMAFIDLVNSKLVEAGLCPPPQDWDQVLKRARAAQLELAEQQRADAARQEAADAEECAIYAEEARQLEEEEKKAREAIAAILEIPVADLIDEAFYFISQMTHGDDEAREAWATQAWVGFAEREEEHYREQWEATVAELQDDFESGSLDVPTSNLSPELHGLVKEGETSWALERNAAAAGFHSIDAYLKWRANEQAGAADGIYW
jgi:hypothetical protein